jgi:hypothetical protein
VNGTPTFERFISDPEVNVIVLLNPGLLPISVSAFRNELRSEDIAYPARKTVLLSLPINQLKPAPGKNVV